MLKKYKRPRKNKILKSSARTAITFCRCNIMLSNSDEEDQNRKKRKVSFCSDNAKDTLSCSLSACEKRKDKQQDSLKDVYKNRHELFAFFSKKKKPNDVKEEEGRKSTNRSILRNTSITKYTTCSMIQCRNIQSWKNDEIFVNANQCSRGRTEECRTCLEAMFSRQLRGKPIADLEWFQDQELDHVTSKRYRNIYSKIAYKYFFSPALEDSPIAPAAP